MQVREKSGQTLTELITEAEFKTYIGLLTNDQDDVIYDIIAASRVWFEENTGRSVISKVYEVEFEKADGYENWYELPYSPVTAIASVEIGGTAVGYSEKGLNVVSIYPESVISTGTTNNSLAVEFTAGGADSRAKLALMRICADYYDARKDNPNAEISSASLKWDTMKLVNQLSNNVSI